MHHNTLPTYGDRVAAFNALPWPRRDAAPRPRADVIRDIAVIDAAMPLYCSDLMQARRLRCELQHELARQFEAELAAALAS